MDASRFLTDDKIRGIFNSFDIDNSGEITVDNLKVAFSKFGREVSTKEIEEIMKAHDIDGGKTIDYDEFQRMLLGKDL